METRGRARKRPLEKVDGPTIELESRQDQLNDKMEKAFSDNMDVMQGVLNTAAGELTEKNNALEAMVLPLKEQTKELNICKVALGNGVLAAAPKPNIDVSKSKELNKMRLAMDVDNFLWEMKQYFRAKGIMDDATKFYSEYATNKARAKLRWLTHQCTVMECVREFSELMLQISNLGENEVFFSFMVRLKLWAKKVLQLRGVSKLFKAMTIAESLFYFVQRRNKFESSKPRGKGNGKGDEKQLVGNSNNNGGNGKLLNGKWKPNNKPNELVRCFLCEGLYIVKNCPKQSLLSTIEGDDEPDTTSMGLGSIQHFVEAKRVKENKKKPMKCFLYCGPHKL
ncbi:hypothetical protein J1N35_000644 [Gossypium stocksii]|uniref:Retrotransposon gag domain-containing protein n=1 Tax=Gossypium stocksii TaxID=47602 RepID=A0A9D3WHU9_9ROSI|nr:hypothetical protein J1N35_000644 [Gossypium stocksii]